MSSVASFAVPPVEKSILVRCDPARAFAAFTAEIAQWWPIRTHSVAQAQARSVAIEPKAGGRVYETAADGTESDWGHVLAWSPPTGFSMTWHPGRSPDAHTVVEVSFAAEGGATRVRLVHRGWEALGKDGATSWESYNGGWDMVLGQAFGGHLARAG